MPPRRVRSGELFNSDELDRGEVELEEVRPTPEELPPDEQAEPWNATEYDPRFGQRLRAYREFLQGLEEERNGN